MFLKRANGTSPPYDGGQGGLRGIASTLGPCDNSAEDSPSRNRTRLWLRGDTPPAPPFKGGTTRNGIRTKTRLVQDELFNTPAPSPDLGSRLVLGPLRKK